MPVDEAVFTELLKMSTDELCCLVGCDLRCLAGLHDSGVAPTSASYKHYLAEVEAARFILTERL